MIYIYGTAVLTVLLMAFALYLIRRELTIQKHLLDKTTFQLQDEWFKSSEKTIFSIMIAGAILIRIVCAIKFSGHADVECFKYWGYMLSEHGFRGFYESEGLADYLPGYLYVLGVMGKVVSLLGLSNDAAIVTLLFKMPAIICDFIIAGLIYRVSKKSFNKRISTIITMLFLFNPLVILNSAIWGQIDSVLTMMVLLMITLVYENKLEWSYIVYGIGFLIKPQMAFFTPVLILAVVERTLFNIEKDCNPAFRVNVEELKKQIGYIVLSVAGTLLLCVPFGVKNVISQCFETLGSYEFATVNAYNFWGMLGLDWASQDEVFLIMTYRQWGTLFIVLLVLFSVVIWMNNFKERSRYIVIGAILGIGAFTLSVRMHERYIFPAIFLLLLLFIYTKRTGAFWLYTVFSAISFVNCAHVLKYYDPYNFDARAEVIIVTGLLQSIAFVFLVIYVLKNYVFHVYKFTSMEQMMIPSPSKRKTVFEIETTDNNFRMSKNDWIVMSLITVIYCIVAFINLGDRYVPQSGYEMDTNSNSIVIELDETDYVGKIEYFLGNYEERQFSVYFSDDGQNWEYFDEFEMNSVFCWDTFSAGVDTKFIKLELLNDKAVINEIVLKDIDDNVITPSHVTIDNYERLFDEQELAVASPSYRNGTIFDEIYHARTGYEFNNGLYTYEWTHPPLGKIFIGLGMKIFGTTPFGWRFFGTLFGVLMLPFIYVFGKRMTKSTFFAAFATTLMSVDFMHFTQSRIATIDVFVTFFIILMYVFMYWYTTMSFYDTKLVKTFIPLGLCGISFGLGCASKWTGVYAGAGLAVIFFYTMYVRYKEYIYAKADPLGVTSGYKHSEISQKFPGNFVKTIVFCIFAFIVIPVIIYTLSYIPFVGGDDSPTSLVGRMLYNQTSMFNYHKDCVFEHPFSSRWYEWPIMIKPILYYSGTDEFGMSQRISAFGNPAVWWFGIASFIFMIYLVKKYKDKTALFLMIGYLAQLLPWTLVGRTTFIYHYFPSVPFVVLMNTYFFATLYKKDKKNIKYAVIYMAISIVLFFIFYPCLSGKSMSEDYDIIILRWMTSWYV